MSGIPHLHVPVRLRGGTGRLSMAIVTLLVICAVAVGAILIASGDSHSSSPSVSSSTSHSGGPNEAARGQSAATSADAYQPTTGGPDESARGQSAASASRP